MSENSEARLRRQITYYAGQAARTENRDLLRQVHAEIKAREQQLQQLRERRES